MGTYQTDQQAVGAGGCKYVADTSAVTGSFFMIEVLEAATFSALTAGSDCDVATGVEIPVGAKITSGIGITGFTLTSGKVIAYTKA